MRVFDDLVKDIKLANCPFCGHTPSIWIEDDDSRWFIGHISCNNCNAEMNATLTNGKGPLDQDKLTGLVLNWNVRINSLQVHKLDTGNKH